MGWALANGVKTRRFMPRLVRKEDVIDLRTVVAEMLKRIDIELNANKDEIFLVESVHWIMTKATAQHAHLIELRDEEKTTNTSDND
jgi:hypothetical protein